MRTFHHLSLGLLFMATVTLFGQHVEINSQNKTIAISADSSATADPEIAVLHIGYYNFGRTKEQAYKENIEASAAVIKKLRDIGVSASQIESSDFSLDRLELNTNWSAEVKQERQFKAHQSWKITAPVSKAEVILDAAVAAGANESSEPDWQVANPSDLQAKASAAALAKARKVAEEMATGLGAKLGKLVYASNKAGTIEELDDSVLGGQPGGGAFRAGGGVGGYVPEPKLKLFPKKVKEDATVLAVFSIE
jgi:uncharacterized protein YggE